MKTELEIRKCILKFMEMRRMTIDESPVFSDKLQYSIDALKWVLGEHTYCFDDMEVKNDI